MPRYIVKLHDDKFNKDYYFEWSTIVDAPVTYGCSLDEFKEYYQSQYGNEGMKGLAERLQRVEINGISSLNGGLSELVPNRAGKEETSLSLEEILENYCRNQNEL